MGGISRRYGACTSVGTIPSVFIRRSSPRRPSRRDRRSCVDASGVASEHRHVPSDRLLRMDASVLENALFSVMAAMMPFLFVLTFWVAHRLRTRHPTIYDELRLATTFREHSMRDQWLFWKFMCSSRPKELGDPTLANVVRFIRGLFLCCLAIFGCLAATTLFGKS
jgi:hypothetical protein